jgi:ribonuclease HIII
MGAEENMTAVAMAEIQARTRALAGMKRLKSTVL